MGVPTSGVLFQRLNRTVQDPVHLVLVELVYRVDPASVLVRVAHYVNSLLPLLWVSLHKLGCVQRGYVVVELRWLFVSHTSEAPIMAQELLQEREMEARYKEDKQEKRFKFHIITII